MATSGTVAFSVDWNGFDPSAACFVYVDRKPCGEPFYVGIGGKGRVLEKKRKNALHANIVNKYAGFSRTVIEEASVDLCKEFEAFLISEIGRRDKKAGTLSNATDGGDGTRGRIVTDEERAKNPAKKHENRRASSERMRINNPMKVAETAKKVSDMLLGRSIPRDVVEKIREANTGHKRSEQIRAKFSLAQKGLKKPGCSINNAMKRPEVRLKNSLSQKGRVLAEDHLLKLRVAHKGRMWAVNLETGKSIGGKPEKILPLISAGTHKRGRKL